MAKQSTAIAEESPLQCTPVSEVHLRSRWLDRRSTYGQLVGECPRDPEQLTSLGDAEHQAITRLHGMTWMDDRAGGGESAPSRVVSLGPTPHDRVELVTGIDWGAAVLFMRAD